MKKYQFDLSYHMTASLEIEAESKAEAIQKYEDGEYEYNDIQPDEELYGGIPYDLTRVVEVEYVK